MCELLDGDIKFADLYNNGRIWTAYVHSNICIRSYDKEKLNEYKNMKDNQPHAYIYTKYGPLNGKITKSAFTKVDGKNVGKSNETSNLEQAVLMCESMIKKKVQAGYSNSIDSNITTYDEDGDVRKIYPMALDLYSKHKNKIKYPVMIQPKLDGVRMLGLKDKLMSRRLHEITGFSSIRKELNALYEILSKDYNLKEYIHFIDGEIYVHGKHLQDISGIVRSKEDIKEKEDMEYHIFDICISEESGIVNFEDRYSLLKELFSKGVFTKLILVDTIKCNREEDGDNVFADMINNGYEGVVYKSINDAKYESSYSKEKRSSKYLKRKKVLDAEFKIVGFGEGNGKFKGMVIFKLETESGNTFDCVTTGTADFRKKIYIECVKDFSKFYGKLAKVKFDDYSLNGTPTRGVIVQIDRDVEFD